MLAIFKASQDNPDHILHSGTSSYLILDLQDITLFIQLCYNISI